MRTSDHTWSLHKLTSYSSSTTNFPWLFSIENSELTDCNHFPYKHSALVSQPRLSYNRYSTRTTDRKHNLRGSYPASCCCLATSYNHSSYCCVFTISFTNNGNTLPIVGQEFVFAGTCLPSCCLATDIHATISKEAVGYAFIIVI
jgi:hypothetical protein